MKKVFAVIISVLIIFGIGVKPIFAVESLEAEKLEAENPVKEADVTIYYGIGCPHCEKAIEFLDKLQLAHPELKIKKLEVYNNQENQEKMMEIAGSLGITIPGVPFIVIGDEYMIGYGNEETSGQDILEYLSVTMESEEENQIHEEVNGSVQKSAEEKTGLDFNIPFFGKINSSNVSLPLFTIIIAAIDGFNPCAMWTLMFLISLLIGMKDTKRMWFLGIVFVASSAFVYFLFLASWFNFFKYVGHISWIKTVIGFVAIGAGTFYLKEAITNPAGACKVTGNKNRQAIFEKLKALTLKQSLIISAIGIMALAVAVNVVELACSAGLPAVYTQVLSLSSIPRWQHYMYLLLYVFIFMIDDLFIFVTAMISLRVMGIDGKYSQISHWVGGIILLILGILLIFKPELLMIG